MWVRMSVTAASCGRAEAVVVERAADPLHRTRIDAKALGYLAHALGAPGRLQSREDSRFQLCIFVAVRLAVPSVSAQLGGRLGHN